MEAGTFTDSEIIVMLGENGMFHVTCVSIDPQHLCRFWDSVISYCTVLFCTVLFCKCEQEGDSIVSAVTKM